ncbi:MAG: DPP IV N-terminal domain-containing protein [Bacteroidia bacterium]
MKKIILLFLGCSCFLFSPAQNKLLTMEDVVLNARTTLAPAKIPNLKWIKGTDFYSYTDTTGGEKAMKGTVSGKASALFTLIDLNVSLKKINADTLSKLPTLDWKDFQNISFENGNKIFHFNLLTKSATLHLEKNLGEGAENMDADSVTEAIAYTIDNNIFIFKNGKKIQVTNDAEKNIVNGHSVHRDEFGIFKGTFWSPNGNYLAFYRMDQTMVTDYPIMDLKERPAKGNLIKYPMAGDKSHEVTVGIYDLSSGKTLFLKTGEPKEQYLTNVAWSPDEKSVYVAIVNRDQNHLWFNQYNAQSGDFVKTLFEETDDKYVQPLHTMQFVPKHSNWFIWQSRRDGWNHLYLYGTNGTLLKQLTKGNWEVTDFSGFNPAGTAAYFIANAESPIIRDFYKSDLKSGAIKKLTSGNGTHTVTLNTNFNFFIDNFSSTDVPRKISIINTEGKPESELLNAPNPLIDYSLGSMSVFTLKSSAGDDLYCRMFKPINFDSTKKYPVIVYVYGGPGVQLINNTWLGGADLWYHYMAEHGYILFTLENRGSANRGLKFEQSVFRNLGTVEMDDQLVGVNYLKSLSYVDQKRMGIHGWSYGGFMTTSMITRNPGIFKAAVAGGPVTDWKYYEVMYTERYMDTPQANPDGYKNSDLLNYVKNLDCKLLLIHGTSDDVVVWQHSLNYLKKAVDLNKQLDYFVYPGHPHNVRGKDRIHLLNKISQYFIDNL